MYTPGLNCLPHPYPQLVRPTTTPLSAPPTVSSRRTAGPPLSPWHESTPPLTILMQHFFQFTLCLNIRVSNVILHNFAQFCTVWRNSVQRNSASIHAFTVIENKQFKEIQIMKLSDKGYWGTVVQICIFSKLKGVFAKNERRYRLKAIKKRF